jgi:hypothetical protein
VNVANPNALALEVLHGSQVRTEDVYLGPNVNHFSLRYHSGLLYYNGAYYRDIKKFELRVVLRPNMSDVQFKVPDGLCRSLKGKVTNKTGLTIVRLLTSAGAALDLINTAGAVDFFPAAGTFGEMANDFAVTCGGGDISYAFNETPTGKAVRVDTDGTAVTGSLLIMELEMLVPVNDGVDGQEQESRSRPWPSASRWTCKA